MCDVQVCSLLLWSVCKFVENAKLITIEQSIISWNLSSNAKQNATRTDLRGPESVLIIRSPYKVIIRALQLVLLYVLASIG